MEMIGLVSTYVHFIGLALGFGGALMSDAMFFSSIKDKNISLTEYQFLRLGAKIVWIGLFLLLLSGIGLVWVKPAIIFASKFQIKMIMISVIVLNGMVFHLKHLPFLGAQIDFPLHKTPSFLDKSLLLVMSGAISVISWFSVVLMGALRGLPYGIVTLVIAYIAILAVGLCGAVLVNTIALKRAGR
jgi:hypothetical protein